MPESSESLIDRLGGPPAVAAIIQDMYRRILADPELAPFFAKTSMERLAHMQYEFVVAALDGPVSYSGAELTAVHHGRGITGRHFAAFCGHFADAMEARFVSQHDINLVLSKLAMFKDQITGQANVDG